MKVAITNLDQFLNLKNVNLIKLKAEFLEKEILEGGISS